MRKKAALIILAIAFAITAVNLGSNLFLIRRSLTETMGREISLALAGVFIAASIIAAVLMSGYIAKPYNKIAEQNSRLEELNQTAKIQADKLREMMEDIRAASSKLAVESSTLKTMFDLVPDLMFCKDLDLNYTRCNESLLGFFNLTNENIIGKGDVEGLRIPEKIAEEYRTMDRMIINERKSFTYEEHVPSPDGSMRLVETTKVPLLQDGEVTGIMGIAHDITERKAIEEAAKNANQVKSDFLAKMSHEMRTPLNAVVGLSELILNAGDAHGEVEDKLNKIYASGMTILGIVNDILDISKIESGKFELQPVEYDTPSLINDIVSLNIIRISEKPISFKLTVDENLPALLFGDDLRIKQIFNNLLSNAFKYTDSGVVEWYISFEKDGESVWIGSTVKDTGIGIKSEYMEKLFAAYNQADPQVNRKTEGTGLGLTITKRLLDIMDGTVTVESEYGKGSEFIVRFRQKFVSDEPIGREVAENLMESRFIASKRAKSAKLVRIDMSYAHVLIVDDVQTNLDIAKGMLKPYGMKVDCATGGRQATDMIRAENPRYNAVFMDHMMPGMDGIEAVRIIREEIGTDYTKNIPIIALTANAIVGNEKMFLEKGFQAFISKPIDMMLLDSVLRQWVRDKSREKDFSAAIATVSETAEPKHTLLGGMIIEGVDMNRGMRRFGNSEAAYIEVLKSYARNTRPIVGRMREYLAAENINSSILHDYAVAVHGIKGASFGICAAQAGEYAKRLEQWAKSGEKEKVLAENGTFTEYMENLLDSINVALAKYVSENAKPVKAEPDPILLKELRKACGDYDMDNVDKTMSQIESFIYERGSELVIWLREQVDNMHFEELSRGDWIFKTPHDCVK
ncbi:MAG: ATP-binding protein [Oscillospiraceae bacterium]|nr:ATP-binding protein [Oscillospiraceae bacterium]